MATAFISISVYCDLLDLFYARCIAELTVMAVDNINDNYVLLLHHSFLDNIMHVLLTINILIKTNAEAIQTCNDNSS